MGQTEQVEITVGKNGAVEYGLLLGMLGGGYPDISITLPMINTDDIFRFFQKNIM